MSDEPTPAGDVFNVARIRELVQLMEEHDLRELDLRQDEMQIRLSRGAVAQVAPLPAAAPPPPPTAAHAPAPAEAPAAKVDAGTVEIKCPMVGTFYSASSPDSPPYVKVGDHVSSTTTVCMVEAMKVFNEIPAEVSGEIVAVLVENGDPVEYGQALFRVKPA